MAITGTVGGTPFTAQVERGTPKTPLCLRLSTTARASMPWWCRHAWPNCTSSCRTRRRRHEQATCFRPCPALAGGRGGGAGAEGAAGERVAVIEAMKMENVLFAAADGVVGKVLATKG